MDEDADADAGTGQQAPAPPPSEAVAFGRELLAQGDWDARLPLVLAEAHWNRSCVNGAAAPDYFAADPTASRDLNAVCGEYLRRVPDSRFHRSRLAMAAAWSGQWLAASEQFQQLEGLQSLRAVQDRSFQDARLQAAHHARVILEGGERE